MTIRTGRQKQRRSVESDSPVYFRNEVNGMGKRFVFADRTVSKAVSLDLPARDVQLIVQTLLKYPVSLFDFDFDELAAFSEIRDLVPDFMIRVSVNASKTISGLNDFKLIRFNWNPICKNEADFLNCATKIASDVYLGVENAQSLDIEGFSPCFKWAERAHAKGVIYGCDGTEEPEALCEKLIKLAGQAPCPVEFETRNSLGLATAQSLAAVKAGLSCVSASAAGLCGDTPLEEALMAAKHLWHCDFSQGKNLAGDFGLIASLLGVKLPCNKALIGQDVFAHESGIHVDGIIKDPSIYEAIRPEDVGLKRKLVIGKHSGTASLKIKALQHGLRLADEDAVCLLESVRELAQAQKGPLSDKQLMELISAQSVKREARG